MEKDAGNDPGQVQKRRGQMQSMIKRDDQSEVEQAPEPREELASLPTVISSAKKSQSRHDQIVKVNQPIQDHYEPQRQRYKISLNLSEKVFENLKKNETFENSKFHFWISKNDF